MTRYPDLELALRADFRARADATSTDAQFDAILERAAATRQRPAWLVPVRSHTPRTRLAWAVAAAAVVAGTMFVALSGGGPLPVTSPRATVSPSAPLATLLTGPRTNGKIMYATYESVLRLHTIDPDGSHLQHLFTSWGEGGVFAADGEHIISPQAIFGVDGRDITVLTLPKRPLALSVLDMSPDGSRFLATGSIFDVGMAGGTPEAAEYGIYSVRAPDGGDARKLFALSAWGWGSARFSPDGALVASIVPNAAGDVGQLWLIGADGSGARPLGSIVNPRSLDWSPDGTSILVWSEAGIFVVDVATGGATEIVPGIGGPLVSPVWSPDGTRILVKRRVGALSNSVLLTMDARGGDVHQVTPEPSNIWFFDWGSHPVG